MCRWCDQLVRGNSSLFVTVSSVVCSSLHTCTLYLSCSLCCVSFKSVEFSLCRPQSMSLPRLSLSPITGPLPPRLSRLSSVHIGGSPECCACSLTGYLFYIVIFIADEYADVLIFGICCVYVVLRRRCVCRRQVYMCVCTVQKPQKTCNPQRSLHPSHWIQMCHYLYVSQISKHTQRNTCILYRIKNVP